MSIFLSELRQDDPDPPNDKECILIEEDECGSWFGTSFGAYNGRQVPIYVSLMEDDVSLGKAIAAASAWASDNGVDRIYIRRLAG